MFLIDGQYQNPSIGDYVGVFTSINSIEKCVGYTTITNESDTINFSLKAYGKVNSLDTIGYEDNSMFRIRWWSKAKNCQTVAYFNDSTYRLDPNATFTIIRNIAIATPFILYFNSSLPVPVDTFYTKATFITPIDTVANTAWYRISLGDFKFNNTSKLEMYEITGAINLRNTNPGIYIINFTSDYCLRNNSFEITIKDSLPTIIDTSKAPILTNLHFDILSPGCKTLGSIHFKENTIQGKKPFVFQLSTNYSPDVITNTNGKFDELREGNYQLTVRDSTGKETKYGKTISLIKQGDCTSSVLAPNSKDGLQAIFIPETGTANILNRDGAIIKRLTIPAEWDGRDSNGNDVPMGDYYLFINEQQSKVITVIK